VRRQPFRVHVGARAEGHRDSDGGGDRYPDESPATGSPTDRNDQRDDRQDFDCHWKPTAQQRDPVPEPAEIGVGQRGHRYRSGNRGCGRRSDRWHSASLEALAEKKLTFSPSQARRHVSRQPKGPRQACWARCDDHLYRAAWREGVALLDIRPELPAANRPVPEVVLVVQVRIEREEDRIVGRHVAVWAAVGEATALDEPEVSDVVYGAILPRHHERGLATGGQGKVLRKDGVEYDVFATVRLAKDP